MNQQNSNKIMSAIASFIGIGIFIVLLVIGFIFFSYVLILGAIIGLVLFGIAYFRAKWFARNRQKQTSDHPHGRTIDQK